MRMSIQLIGLALFAVLTIFYHACDTGKRPLVVPTCPTCTKCPVQTPCPPPASRMDWPGLFDTELFDRTRTQLEAVANAVGDLGEEGFSAQVPGQVSLYRMLFSLQNVRSIAEIGFNGGHSTLLMLVSNPVARIQSFDMGSHTYGRPTWDFLKQQFPAHEMSIAWGDSRQTVPEFHRKNPDQRFDVVIVDGGHDHEVAMADIMNMRALSHKHTILVIDDTPCQAPYCVDTAVEAQERAGVIKVETRYPFSTGRACTVARYIL